MLFVLDLIELDGEEFRPLPLGKRKATAGTAAGPGRAEDRA
jgi:hypothetical protein